MEKNRNLIIGGLIALLVICSIWGSINSRSAKTLQLELDAVNAELKDLKAGEAHPVEAAPAPAAAVVDEGKIHELEAQVAELKAKEEKFAPIVEQLNKARAELVAVRKASKRMEAQLVQQEGVVKKLQKAVAAKEQMGTAAGEEVAALQASLDEAQKGLAAAAAEVEGLKAAQAEQEQTAVKLQEDTVAAGEALAACQEQLNAADQQEEEVVAKQVAELETALAQILGLEKIVEEKNAAFEETSRELDRVKVNMDVLLGKISEQQDALQELEQENSELIKDLTSKNQQLADLQDQLAQEPLQQN